MHQSHRSAFVQLGGSLWRLLFILVFYSQVTSWIRSHESNNSRVPRSAIARKDRPQMRNSKKNKQSSLRKIQTKNIPEVMTENTKVNL